MNLTRKVLPLGVMACIFLLVAPTVYSEKIDDGSLWFSRINVTHKDPTDMLVIVVPAAYFSKSSMVDDTAWVGADALLEEPGVQATLEAIEYWAWMIDQYETQYPQLAKLTYTVKVLGVDATLADVQEANIVVNTAMVADPAPFLFHLGLGYPTSPLSSPAWINWGGQRYPAYDGSQDLCTVWNTGFGQDGTDTSPLRLRNLVIHEFGHCLGAGHTGESLGADHCNRAGTCYENHKTDVMSLVFGNQRQCLSNLNIMSLAEGYEWAAVAPFTWKNHDSEVYQLKSDYATTCMPSGMNRF